MVIGFGPGEAAIQIDFEQGQTFVISPDTQSVILLQVCSHARSHSANQNPTPGPSQPRHLTNHSARIGPHNGPLEYHPGRSDGYMTCAPNTSTPFNRWGRDRHTTSTKFTLKANLSEYQIAYKTRCPCTHLIPRLPRNLAVFERVSVRRFCFDPAGTANMSGAAGQELCPLCVEPLDATERAIQFCSCGFTLCRFCWKKLMESETGRCPNCREAYDETKLLSISSVKTDDLSEDASRKKKKKGERKRGIKLTGQERRNLQELRILQKNLVYAVGLSLDICIESVMSDSVIGWLEVLCAGTGTKRILWAVWSHQKDFCE